VQFQLVTAKHCRWLSWCHDNRLRSSRRQVI